MANHPNRANRYIIISPRGFSNETIVRYGSAAAVKIAAEIIGDNVNAWAEIVPAKDRRVIAAKRAYAKTRDYFGVREAEREGKFCRLSEADVRPHRPWFLASNGPCYQGGPRLPEGYDNEG